MNKKIRFEVFKRDGFKCGYCGQSPPTVTLEVDHINTKSMGGTDDINNLITACFDCNRGKKHIPLTKIPPKISDNLEVLQEQEQQLKAYNNFIRKIQRRLEKDIERINDIYREQYEGWCFSGQFKNISVKTFLRKLPYHEVQEAMYIAINKFPKNHTQVIKYFCGICWRKIKSNEQKVH